jgi:RHS repeat-associated protein
MPEAQATVVRHADGGEWLHRYDGSLSVTEIIEPYGGSRRFEYDAEGRLVAETDPGGNRRTALHDATGEVTAWINAAGGVRPADDPTGPPAHRVPRTAAELELGDLASEVLLRAPLASAGLEPLMTGGASIFSEIVPERDPRVEPSCRRDEQGILSTEARDGASPRRWMYTPNGWLRKYVDHEGARYEFEYASWNHRVLARDPLDREIRYEYTPSEQIAAVVDPAGNRHEYRYDLRDALTEVRHSGSLVESYQHDRAGNWIGKRDACGELLFSMTYGEDNLLARRRLAGGVEHVHKHTPDGRVATITWGEHLLEFAHTAGGRRCRDVRDGRGVEHVFVDERLAETRVLDRFVTRYRRLDDKTLELTDPLGNRHALVLEGEGVVVRRMACGAREVAQYHSLGRCLGKHLFADDTGEPVWRRRFEYSPEGDLVRIDDSAHGPIEYRHDAAHQIAEVHAPGTPVATYRHDVAGNLMAAPHLTEVVIAPGNKLVQANGGGLTYDLRNNVASWRRAGRDLQFHRDELDHIRRIDGLDLPWSAEYDPRGRRIRKSYGDETTEYFWDTDRLAAELRPDGTLQVYVYLDDFALIPWLAIEYDAIDADPASGRLHYLLTDQRGAPVAALDAEGRQVWTASLDPHGNARITRAKGSTFALPHRLAGQLHDPETDLCYHRFRYYAPELGRYLEEDPAGIGGGVNLYAYTYNPLVHFDPRGLTCSVQAEHKKALDDYIKKYQDMLDNPGNYRHGQVENAKKRISEAIGELAASNYMSKNYPDYEMVRGFAEGKGVDQIWVKKDGSEIIVVEAKANGSPLGTTESKGRQMSQEWMDKTAASMKDKTLENALNNGDPKVKGIVVEADKDGQGATERPLPTDTDYPDNGIYN